MILLLAVLVTYAAAKPRVSGVAYSSPEAEYLNHLNYSRQVAGLWMLCWDSGLIAKAEQHALEMAKAGQIYHSTAGELLASLPQSTRMVTENVGVGYDLRALHVSFLASPTHAANIYRADLTHVGVGVVTDVLPSGIRYWIVIQSMSNYVWACNQ